MCQSKSTDRYAKNADVGTNKARAIGRLAAGRADERGSERGITLRVWLLALPQPPVRPKNSSSYELVLFSLAHMLCFVLLRSVNVRAYGGDV